MEMGIRDHYKWLKPTSLLLVCNKKHVLEITISDWNITPATRICWHICRIRDHYKWLKQVLRDRGQGVPFEY